jgi:hypothetical protein
MIVLNGGCRSTCKVHCPRSEDVMDTSHHGRLSGSGLLCLLALVLAACGGGGGGGSGGTAPPSIVEVTAANQDAVARASVVAVQGGLFAGSLGITASGPSAPLAAVTGPALRRAVLAEFKMPSATRKSKSALLAPLTELCTVSGSVTATIDDRDNSGALSVGDVLGVSFDACSEIAGEVLNGSASATYTQIVLTPTLTVGASVAVTSLSFAEPGYSASIDGGFEFTYGEPSAAVATTRLTVPNALALRATTPAYSDTITLLDGYIVDSSYDMAALPPGGAVPGRTTSTASGKVASASAGGYVQMQTLEPIVQYDVDDFPRSGRLSAVGSTGNLQVTVLSSTQVRIDLDADGNGSFEASKVVAWTQLR